MKPLYLDSSSQRWTAHAAKLIETFEHHLSERRETLDEAIKELIGDRTDYLVFRGFRKLLEDRCEFAVDSKVDPRELRQKVFEAAADAHPVVVKTDHLHKTDRKIVLELVCRELGIDVEDGERALYADLPANNTLVTFDRPDPSQLVERYNLALAQAVLLRASELRVTYRDTRPRELRALLRRAKFHRLMVRAEAPEPKVRILVFDGPLSLFSSSQKYGLQMASFLPALLLTEGWSLEADLAWGPERRRTVFRLDPSAGLTSHYRQTGTWVTPEEEHFVARWRKADNGWAIGRSREVLDLGGRDLLVPDWTVKDQHGRKVLIEVIGFWKRDSLLRRLELLKQHAPSNVLLLVPQRLKGSDGALPELPGEVLFYKGVIPVKRVLDCVEGLAGEVA